MTTVTVFMGHDYHGVIDAACRLLANQQLTEGLRDPVPRRADQSLDPPYRAFFLASIPVSNCCSSGLPSSFVPVSICTRCSAACNWL